MSFAVVHSRALRGLDAPAVTVEVHLANGLPSFTLVGLADTEVKESRERVRAALQTQRPRVPAQQAHHGQPGAGRPAQGVGPLRPADRARHPRRQRPDRRRRGSPASSSPASCRWRRAAAGARRAGDGAGAAARAGGDAAHAGAAARQRATRRRWSAACAVRGAGHLLDVVRALLPGDAADASGAARCRAAAARRRRRRCPTCAT